MDESTKNEIQKIQDKIDTMIQEIFEISVINMNFNDLEKQKEEIESNDPNWRILVNDIKNLESIIGSYEELHNLEAIISNPKCIDRSLLDDLRVSLNNLENEIKRNEKKMHSSPIEMYLQQMDILEGRFITSNIPGLPKVKSIYKDEMFLEWKAGLTDELCKLESNKLISEIFDYFNKFNGLEDEKSFKNIKANLKVLCQKGNLVEKTRGNQAMIYNNKKVFIVHGHNEDVRNNVELFIRRLELTPIILCNEASCGRSILEKIIDNSDVGFAIVLYTACDEGKEKGSSDDYKPRARQNVVFEHGFMIGKLGRNRVIALIENSDIDIPGDYSGVVYIKLTDNDWKDQVKRELAAANIDFNTLA